MDANLGKNHKYLFRIRIIESCWAGKGGGGERVGMDVNQLGKPAFRSQCAHTEHSEGPMDTVLPNFSCRKNLRTFVKMVANIKTVANPLNEKMLRQSTCVLKIFGKM